MPPRMSQEKLDAMGRRFAGYTMALEHCSAPVRYLPNIQELYDTALKEWDDLRYVGPPLGDQKKLDEFYDAMDKMCYGEHLRPEDFILGTHAANAAIQVMIDYDMRDLSEKNRLKVIKIMADICAVETAALCAEAPAYSAEVQISDAVLESLPPHIQGAFNPARAAESQDPFEALLDQEIRYREDDGTIVECVMVDYGTSVRLPGGKYYTFLLGGSGEGGAEKEVTWTQNDLQEILLKRVA